MPDKLRPRQNKATDNKSIRAIKSVSRVRVSKCHVRRVRVRHSRALPCRLSWAAWRCRCSSPRESGCARGRTCGQVMTTSSATVTKETAQSTTRLRTATADMVTITYVTAIAAR